MSKIIFTELGWEDYVYWQSQDKKTIKKINLLLQDICRNGYDGIGKPEPLKGDRSGFWSRRIDDANRIVYRVTEDAVEIIQCKGHYDE
ncbi:MAG: Txe/YoeB family addiction module toxin [Oscillospiraceae bacterium]|nr:Txe/YoeB family addiction module toxin [Oscillospiraceae bacterium]